MIDYKHLLRRYIQWVEYWEGNTYVADRYFSRQDQAKIAFTEEEWKELSDLNAV